MAAEARALIPEIFVAQVKIGLGQQLALHMAPADARDLVRDTAARATANIDKVSPLFLMAHPMSKRSCLQAARTPVISCVPASSNWTARPLSKPHSASRTSTSSRGRPCHALASPQRSSEHPADGVSEAPDYR